MRVFQEGNETAQIDLTDSLTSGINRARQTLGTLIVCIIQVSLVRRGTQESCGTDRCRMTRITGQSLPVLVLGSKQSSAARR
jgi:hypothetical protein